jgi:serine/threonine-protein kinase
MDASPALTAALADRYRIERELGQGGMATVYLAEDLRHHRKVALKVLKPELAAMLGGERFVHEITTTAALQHPNILPLFDSGEAGQRGSGEGVFLYYVMPYVEGETLRTKLNRETQLGIDEAVKITIAVADALDYAHRHGVIHRDIKPENILLHDGRPVVADFGIALALSAAAGGRLTETGLSLGTPHYMSPEQATAEKELSPRSDIYSLGSVLYEMLTGNPPHTGASAQQIIMKIVTEEAVPVTRHRKSVPPNVAAAVSKALEKLPADRFASAAEFAAALTSPTYTRPLTGVGAAAGPASRRWKQIALAAGAAALGCAVLALWAWLRPAPTQPVTRFGIAFPDSQLPRGVLELTRDGSRLVYEGPGDSAEGQLWVKDRDRSEATPIPGTDNARGFTLSPDGKWIAFVINGKLKKMPISGGAAVTVADSAFFSGAAWLDDGTIVYTSNRFKLMRVSDAGGPSTELVDLSNSQRLAGMPTPLPRGRGVIFTSCVGTCVQADLWVCDLVSDKARRLVSGVLKGWYLPSGHLMYVGQNGEMFAGRFDLKALELRGTPVPVISGVGLVDNIVPMVTVSFTGTLVMRAGNVVGGQRGVHEMVWVDRAGRRLPVDSGWTFRLTQSASNVGWALSPDGSRLVIGLYTSSGDDLWLKQLPDGPLSRLTFDSAAEWRPRWTPDGQFVTFIESVGNRFRRRRADGTGTDETLLSRPNQILEGFVSHDGAWLVARTGGIGPESGGRDIVAMRLGVDSVAAPLVADPRYDEEAPALSPDGRWLAYESDETGRTEVYIRPFPNTEGGKWQVSLNGGQAPLWAHSSRELFFVDGARNMVATPVGTGTPLQLGERRLLFRLDPDIYLGNLEHYTPFDISPDDRRFIMARQLRGESEPAQNFLLVENWFEELKAKVGAR